MADKPTAIFIMGPTASGKTDLAVALGDHYPVELISVDSALVYKGMDIGSAKPDAETLARAPHRLIDIRDPAESYSVGEFARDARKAMDEISGSGKIPVLVGGTMLYFKALLDGLAELPPSDPQVRQQIESEAAEKGWPAMHQKLAELDPESAERIHPNHSQRIGRALEVCMITGRPFSELLKDQQQSGKGVASVLDDYDVIQVAVAPASRKLLHQRIDLRFTKMLEQGLLDEVRELRKRPELNVELPSIRAVGYRQAWEYLEGKYSYQEMIAKGNAATRQLAKRQLTWLRGWPEHYWLQTDDAEGNALEFEEILLKFLQILANAPIYFSKA